MLFGWYRETTGTCTCTWCDHLWVFTHVRRRFPLGAFFLTTELPPAQSLRIKISHPRSIGPDSPHTSSYKALAPRDCKSTLSVATRSISYLLTFVCLPQLRGDVRYILPPPSHTQPLITGGETILSGSILEFSCYADLEILFFRIDRRVKVEFIRPPSFLSVVVLRLTSYRLGI